MAITREWLAKKNYIYNKQTADFNAECELYFCMEETIFYRFSIRWWKFKNAEKSSLIITEN